MITPTGYHEKIMEICSDIVNHGFGMVSINIVSQRDDTVKIVIEAGRSWVYFVRKDIDFDKKSLL